MTTRRRIMRRFILIMVLILTPVSGRDLRIDPSTGRVRVLYVGDTLMRTWRDLAFDPLLAVSPVPASVSYSMEHIRRMMRLYLPRTYEAQMDRVDLLILSDTDHALFTSDQQFWFRDGVIGGGLGLIMAGGFEAFGGLNWGSSWKGSSVEDALPVESLTAQAWSSVSFLARPTETSRSHTFITSLPWDAMPPFVGMNKVIPKQGSVVLLESIGLSVNMPNGKPVLVFAEIGKGASVAHAPDWNPGWGADVMDNWEYYGDYVANLAYLTVGVSVPQDLALSHLVRRELAGYFLQKSVALSLLEFADLFGGNIAPLEARLVIVEELKREADQLYISQDYTGVLAKMEAVTDEFTRLNQDAVRAKDQALFWVFFVEWMSITATSLICGFTLWTLMVRRRAYKEVSTTRLAALRTDN